MFSSVGPQEPAMFKNSWLPNSNATKYYETLTPSLAPAKAGCYEEDPRRRTIDPIVTGTSVIAIKYSGGILMAADTLGSYGSLARFRNLRRMREIGKNTILGASGEYSDFQHILEDLDELVHTDTESDDGHHKQPRDIFSYLTRVVYERRNKMDFLYNQLVIAGIGIEKEGKGVIGKANIFLGQIDYNGTFFEDNTIATGYGAYIARPLLRKAYRPGMSEAEAKEILERCMTVLYYRDARTINRIQLSRCEVGADGKPMLNISEPYELPTEWRHTETALGYPRPN